MSIFWGDWVELGREAGRKDKYRDKEGATEGEEETTVEKLLKST